MTDLDPPGYVRHEHGVRVLCRKCGRLCGREYRDGSYVGPCETHGPLRPPSDRDIAAAVAKARATGRPVALRAWPVG
jgi:hypothetical protein